MRQGIWFLVLVGLCASAAMAREPKPGQTCMDARDMLRSVTISPQLVTVATSTGAYRIDLAAHCEMPPGAELSILAREGWVCGGEREFLRAGDALCPIKEVQPIEYRDFTRLTHLAAGRGGQGDVTILDEVEVIGKPSRRGFIASTEYCFDPGSLRGWSKEDGAVVVETSPRRAGGNRHYRIELAGTCSDLAGAHSIQFRSGVGIGVICANPGDTLIVLDSRSGLFAGRTRSSLISGAGCAISAVFPISG
jgi:hypothetical protein